MNESNAFPAGIEAYQSRLRAKLLLIERACATEGLCQRNEREAAEKALDNIVGDLRGTAGSTTDSDTVDSTSGDHSPIVKNHRPSKTRKSRL